MTKDEFWALIEDSRRSTEDLDEQVETLQLLLEGHSEQDILDFDRHFHDALDAAYHWDIWAAAYIINSGCSDDGFDYFMGWLIAQGRKYYEATLADPNQAGVRVEPGDFAECESIWYAAPGAYEKLTGKKDFYERRGERPQRALQGEEWDEETVYDLFPKLAKKFN